MINELPDDIKALLAISPRIEVSRTEGGSYKIEVRHANNEWVGTATRWMSPWENSFKDWHDAIVNLLQD